MHLHLEAEAALPSLQGVEAQPEDGPGDLSEQKIQQLEVLFHCLNRDLQVPEYLLVRDRVPTQPIEPLLLLIRVLALELQLAALEVEGKLLQQVDTVRLVVRG